jgi:hypothetical protein
MNRTMVKQSALFESAYHNDETLRWLCENKLKRLSQVLKD